MKKALSLLLTLAMCTALCVSALAADSVLRYNLLTGNDKADGTVVPDVALSSSAALKEPGENDTLALTHGGEVTSRVKMYTSSAPVTIELLESEPVETSKEICTVTVFDVAKLAVKNGAADSNEFNSPNGEDRLFPDGPAMHLDETTDTYKRVDIQEYLKSASETHYLPENDAYTVLPVMECLRLGDQLVLDYLKGDKITLADEGYYSVHLDASGLEYDDGLDFVVHITKDAAPVDPAAAAFTDVAADYWAKDAIDYAVEHKLFNGTSATTFSPASNMTRGQLVTVLWRMAGSPDPAAPSVFTDVAADSPFAKAIAWSGENQVSMPVEGASFAPGEELTRQEFAAILYNYAKYMKYDTTAAGMAIKEFPDYGDIDAAMLEGLTWANSAGLVNGTSDTTIAPAGTATRAQIATILMRFCENVAK